MSTAFTVCLGYDRLVDRAIPVPIIGAIHMSDANWMDIDVETLDVEAQKAYGEYKAAQRKAAALREAFEATAVASLDIPQGKRMVFGYRFGKLSAALVEDDRKPAKTKQSKGSLADFIAAQVSGGHAS